MKRFLVFATLTGLLSAPVLTQQKTSTKEPTPAVHEKDKAKKPKTLALGHQVDPTIVLADIDGNECATANFRGRITVVNFWATRCPWMKGWDPTLSEIQRNYSKKGVVFLMIASNEGNGEIRDNKLEKGQKPYQEIRKHLKERELPYRVLIDPGSEVARRFGARTTPDIFVFDEDTRLVYRGRIDDDERRKKGDEATHYLRDTLDAMLTGEELDPTGTKPFGCSIKWPKKAVKRKDRRARTDGEGA